MLLVLQLRLLPSPKGRDSVDGSDVKPLRDGEQLERTALEAQHRLEVFLDVAGVAPSTFSYRQTRFSGPDPRASLKADITEPHKVQRSDACGIGNLVHLSSRC